MPNRVALFLAVVFVGIGLRSAGAQQVPCARLLTAAEVTAAAGAGFKNLGQEALPSGESVCTWLLEDHEKPKAIQFTFVSNTGVAGPPTVFEARTANAEKLHGTRRELVPGVGVKAAIVPGVKPGAMFILIVHHANGIAYVETDYLERPQVVALGKAIAAP